MQPARLNTRSIEQVAYQLIQAISLFLNGLEAGTERLWVERGIGTRQRRGVAFDNGDRRLQFMRDHRDEG